MSAVLGEVQNAEQRRVQAEEAHALMQNPRFDVGEFSARWLRARVAAIRKVIGEKLGTEASVSGVGLSEGALLKQVPASDRDAVLRVVFDHSRQLGLSVVKYLGWTWEISDLADVLPHCGSPCFAGVWRLHREARVLERSGCHLFAALGDAASFGCDYWREAVDGLVMGVGEQERLSRHQSLGHGDAQCVDVLFSESFTVPRVVRGADSCAVAPSMRYAPLSEALVERLAPIQHRFESMQVVLKWEGVQEKKLFYRLDPQKGVLCGASGRLMHEWLKKDIEDLGEGWSIQDTAPLAVLGSPT